MWPKETTRELYVTQSFPGPWRALRTVSAKAHGVPWAGKLCSDLLDIRDNDRQFTVLKKTAEYEL